MEPRQSPAMRYGIAALLGALIGGALVLVFDIGSERKEIEQLQQQRDSLTSQLNGFKQRLDPLREEMDVLRARNAEQKAEIERLAAAPAAKPPAAGERAAATAGLEDRNRALAAENEALKKKLASLGEKVEASAAEREALARKLGAAGQTLEQAQSRAAELNKSYETLLTEKTTLAERAAARRAELEKTKKALEEAQSEVARLMGARGIYTVQNGDSLSTIAAFFYRDGLRWPDIFKANGFLISHPDLIYPKQVLIIPQ